MIVLLTVLWWDATSLGTDGSESLGSPWEFASLGFFPGIGCPACLQTLVDCSGVRPGSKKHLGTTFILTQWEGRKEGDSLLGPSSGSVAQVRRRAAGAQLSLFPAVPLTLGKFHSPLAFVTCNCWPKYYHFILLGLYVFPCQCSQNSGHIGLIFYMHRVCIWQGRHFRPPPQPSHWKHSAFLFPFWFDVKHLV